MQQRYPIWMLMVLVIFVGYFLRIEDLNRYPVGINDDEATELVDAHFFRINGKFPFLIYDSSPRGELLGNFVQSTVVFLGGASPFGARLTGVFLGTLGIAAAFWASRESLWLLFPKSKREWRTLAGILGASLLVFAITYLSLSRTPYRAMLQCLIILIFIAFLARGLRLWRWRDFVCTGIFLGLVMYTYTAAYLLPLAMLPLGLAYLVLGWKKRQIWLPRLLLTGVIAGLIAAPMLIRLSDAPNYRLRRTTELGDGNGFALTTIVRVLGDFFFVEGSALPSYNTASAPLIPAIFIPFLALGLLALVWRSLQPFSLFLLAAFICLLIPLILAGDLRHSLRANGLYTIFPIVVTLGAYLLFVLLERFLASKGLLWAGVIGISMILFGGAWQSRSIYRDYWEYPENYVYSHVFGLDLTHNEWFYRADRREFASWLLSLDTPILIPAEEISEIPTRAWLLNEYPNVVTTERFSDLPDNTEFVMPYTIGYADLRTASRDYVLLMDDTVYLLPPLDEATHEGLLALLEDAEPLYREGIIDFLGYYTTLPTNFSLSYVETNTVFPAVFNNQLALINWRGDDTLPANQASSLSVNLEWTALESMWAWYWVSVQIESQDRVFVAREQPLHTNNQLNHILRWLYPTAQWQVGDTVPYRVTLDVPALEAGAYRLTAGVYAIPTRPLVADTDPYGNPTIGWIKVGSPSMVTIPNSTESIGAIFADSIELSATEILPQDNGQVLLRLYWTSLVHRPAFDAFIFVHLYDDSGTIVSQVDARPEDGNYPTLIWDEGEIVMTEYLLDAGGRGDLNLRTGLYTFPDGVNPQRLAIHLNGAAVPDDILFLGSLED